MNDDDDAGPSTLASVEVRVRIDFSAHLKLRPKSSSRVERSGEDGQNVFY
jgi:hypothetical protein